jgi:thiol-disulfide isomerase/thioredoxin
MKLSAALLPLLILSCLAGCSDSPAPTTSDALGKKDAAAETPGEATASPATNDAPATAGASKLKEQITPLLKDLEIPDLEENVTQVITEFEESPKDKQAATQLVAVITQVGLWQESAENPAAAATAFTLAKTQLDEILKNGGEVDERLQGVLHYRLACVEAGKGQPESSMKLLETAVDLGFDRLAEFRTEPQLASVRALPEFEAKLAEWEAAAKARIVEHAKAELAAGESFPFDFALLDVNSNPIKLEDMKGKVCIVDIWGTWCPPCREEIPSFIKLQTEYGEKGLQIIGLNEERGPADGHVKKVTDYIKSAGMNYPCALITSDVLAQVPDFSGFPTTLFIDKKGVVRLKAVGLHDYAYLEAIVQALLEEG